MKFDWRTYEGIFVDTKTPIAVDSPDHLTPWGTARDNHTSPVFEEKFMKLYNYAPELKVLDLGCSGGGFVKNCLDRGCLAIGLEGSNYSKKMHRAHWPLLGNKLLFTADITKPYSIKFIQEKKQYPLHFHLITMWEVLEHLKEKDLTQTFANIKNHLSDSGIFALSVSPLEEIIRGMRLHQTVNPPNWWLERFKKEGFIQMPKLEQYFDGSYVRGPQNARGSANFVFALNPEKVPIPHFDEVYTQVKKKLLIRRILGKLKRKLLSKI